MLDVLQRTGIEIHVATQPFVADGINYPGGTHVLPAAQPYRPHLKDMMERQAYPERRIYPGGPAEAPYDSAGWTLPLQMGVTTVEVVSAFEAALESVDRIDPPLAVPKDNAAAYITRRWGNDDYAIINVLLSEGFDVSVLTESEGGYPAGSMVVSHQERSAELSTTIRDLCAKRPARFEALTASLDAAKLKKMDVPRTALYQPWTASMDEGWTRLVLEMFGFQYTTVHNAEIRAGNLNQRFDCIILPSLSARSILNGVSDKSMPPPYAGGIGQDGAIELERFVEQGGTLVLLNSAAGLASDVLRVPVANALEDLERDTFFCPGSLLRIRVDNSQPLAYGMPHEVAGYFGRSYGFEIGAAALSNKTNTEDDRDDIADDAPPELSKAELDAKLARQPVTSVARYSDNMLLLSGWILGEDYLRNRVAVCEVSSGKGRIVLFGFRLQHRGQPHGTFKFLFNAIYRSTLDT
jgi:hypothetical protein